MFPPFCATQVKARRIVWLTQRRATKETWEMRSITWTQLLRLTTAIHHLHPLSAPRQRSHPRILVGLPARSARHSVIPQRPLLSPIENLSGILKQPAPPHPLPCLLFTYVALTWATPDFRGKLPLTVKPSRGRKGQTCQDLSVEAGTTSHCQEMQSGIKPRHIMTNEITGR